jgi:hypothetical protein
MASSSEGGPHRFCLNGSRTGAGQHHFLGSNARRYICQALPQRFTSYNRQVDYRLGSRVRDQAPVFAISASQALKRCHGLTSGVQITKQVLLIALEKPVKF